jgi:hypothetical protein
MPLASNTLDVPGDSTPGTIESLASPTFDEGLDVTVGSERIIDGESFDDGVDVGGSRSGNNAPGTLQFAEI